MKNKIEKVLCKSLMLDGAMSYPLYEWELKEHIPFWTKEMKKDKDEFVIVITEKDGDAAMLFIDKNEQLYINEDARSKLKKLWLKSYQSNMEQLMPMIVEMLANGFLYVNGVKYSI